MNQRSLVQIPVKALSFFHYIDVFMQLKSKKAKALDLVVSNVNDNIQNFTIDHSLNFTPFSVRKSKSSRLKIYSDHKAVCFDLNIGCNLSKIKTTSNRSAWMFNSPDGDLKFQIITDDAFDWLVDTIENVSDIDEVVRRIENMLNEAKYKSYSRKTLSRKKYEELTMDDIWRARIKELEKIQDEMAEEKEVNKIHKTRTLLNNTNRSR